MYQQATTRSRSLYIAFVALLISVFMLPLFVPMTVSAQADDGSEGNTADSTPSEDESDVDTSALEGEAEAPVPQVPPAPSADTAAEKKETGNLPVSFVTKEKCVQEVPKKTLAQAKAYGDLRAKKRLKKLDRYTILANKQAAEAKNAYKKEAKYYTIDKGVKIKRVIHSRDVVNEIGATKNQIKNKRAAIKLTKTPAEAAVQTCDMIYDIRVYTYLDAKMKNQKAIDTVYRKNTFAQAQFQTLIARAKAAGKDVKMNNPATTKTQSIDPAQRALDAIRPATINAAQNTDPKKKTATIFKETLAAPLKTAIAATNKDTQEGKAIKADLKKSTDAAKKPDAKKNESKTQSTAKKETKKTLTTKQINDACKSGTEASLKDAKGSVLKDLTTACNLGIKAGFKNDKTQNAALFCSDGGGKWTIGKSPKKELACKYGYEKGLALR